jgi:class 3 adenylate cyclase/tetratricopeptide (TPR) repeat protein
MDIVQQERTLDITAWLHSLGLEQYQQAFHDNAIDAAVLPKLTAEDLKDVGVTAVGHRRKLLDAIAELHAGAAGSADTVTTASALVPEEEGERRQVTVLFADLTGYTALSNELEGEEIHALLGCFFDQVDRLVEEHGGHIDKHIGDCVMAVFGAPVAHGNDSERAVRAALAIREAMPDLSARLGRTIGVHIGVAGGQVVASRTGSASHRAYTVTGDTVNLASRLTDAAGSGEILISAKVRRSVGDRFDCLEADPLQAKGFAEPVQVWRLRGVRATPANERPPFVGRQSELRQFMAGLAGCRETGRGQAIYVRGEAGIGKTRLLDEFQRTARAAGLVCHTGLVLDFGAGVGRDAIRALVRSLLGLDLTSDAEAVRLAADRALAQSLVTSDNAVFLNDLLDAPQPAELRALYDAMDSATRNQGRRRTVTRLVERASRAASRLLVVEDLHWADRLTLAHLAELAATVVECPALLVMTSRIEGDPLDPEWRSRIAPAPLMTIDLGPLRREEALALTGTIFHTVDQIAEQCVERAAGNPLFLEQLLRHAEESAEAGVPGSVQNLVEARLDRLEREDKAALQAASVLGQRFSQQALRHLLDRPDYALDRLVAHFLVRPQGEEFLFAHALIRDAVYDTLLKSRGRELHRRAAAWFASRDPVLHAEHLDRAEDAQAPRAYLAAARSQAAEYRYELARHLVERGLGLAAERTDRFALACFHGDILHDMGDMAAALRAYEAALAAADSPAERSQAWIGLAAVKRVTDDLDGAFADLERAEADAVVQGLTAERARIHSLRGNLFFPRGDIEGCLREHGKSLELARAAGSTELEAAALGGLGDAEYMRGRMVSAHDRLHACVELSRQQGLGRIEVANRAQIAHTRLYFRPQQDALEHALSAAAAAAKLGHSRAELNARLAAISACFETADLDACRDHVGQVQTLVDRLEARRFEVFCRLYPARIALAQGQRSEAIEFLQQALDISRRTGIGFYGPQIFGVFALALGSPEERRRMLTEGERVIQAGCVGHNQLRFYPDAMEVTLILGDNDEVERYANALEDYTRSEPLPWSELFVARGRALAAFARGRRDASLMGAIRQLRDEGERLGVRTALPALEAILAK